MTGVTHEYFQLIINIIARMQCIPRVARAQHASYLQISQGTTRLFVNLDGSGYRILIISRYFLL